MIVFNVKFDATSSILTVDTLRALSEVNSNYPMPDEIPDTHLPAAERRGRPARGGRRPEESAPRRSGAASAAEFSTSGSRVPRTRGKRRATDLSDEDGEDEDEDDEDEDDEDQDDEDEDEDRDEDSELTSEEGDPRQDGNTSTEARDYAGADFYWIGAVAPPAMPLLMPPEHSFVPDLQSLAFINLEPSTLRTSVLPTYL